MDQPMEEIQQSSEPEASRIDLNTATAQDLQTVSGLGPALAERILNYRREAGGFLSRDELLAVPGIGPALYDAIANQLTVAPPDEVRAAETVLEPSAGAPAASVSEPATAYAAPRAVREPMVHREAAPGPRLAWLWSALLGALLGVAATLLILASLNGSLVLHQAPVIVDMNRRIDNLGTDMGEMRGELAAVQQRLTLLESLPARMYAVEHSLGQLDTRVGELGTAVGELDTAVSDLQEQMSTLANRLDQAEEDLTAVEQRADRVDGFFLELQSLLTDVFGPPAESSP